VSAFRRVAETTIKVRLIKSFTVAILIPSLITAVVGVLMIRQQVYKQAQARVTSDLEAAKEIYQNYQERLRDSLRIHATRMVIYGALARNDTNELGPEMDRILQAEGLDTLTITDTAGRVFYRTRKPFSSGDDESGNALVKQVLLKRLPVASTEIVPEEELAKESVELVNQAMMEIAATRMAGPISKRTLTSGMFLEGAAPVFTANGRFVGVLYGGVMINRNYEIVDRIRKVVFKDETFGGKPVGTVTIFQDDVRISTNVRNADDSRAITTRASAEVTLSVLKEGNTWRGRAFVVNDWYIAAYAPIRDFDGKTIGMLYVGTLEKPYRYGLLKNLFVFLGITLLGVFLVTWVAIAVAQRISRPIQAMAEAARKIAQGDYNQEVKVSSADEIGVLAENFNLMVSELVGAHAELRVWGENLEKKVEERTAELKAMQAHLITSEKLAAVGKLAAGVAHEINNPLTGILTNSSLMLQDLPPDDPRREDLQTIVDETLRCRKIVKGLLDFARQTKPQKQALDINKVVQDVFSLVRNQASFQNVTLRMELEQELPSVRADADQMRQVFLNIVLNAADAMAGGKGGEIVVRSRFNQATGFVEVAISDKGPGIPEEIRDKLFEPFFSTKKQGTGLGLSIAYGIMERHKGTLKVQSMPGQGTTFTATLPATEENGDEA
jgi:two-component system, NtrC family, sensor kinase